MNAGMGAPLIAISPNLFPAEDRRLYKHKELEYGEGGIAQGVRLAGGVPVMAYRAGAEGDELGAYAAAMMAACDALVLSGGQDVSPQLYGEELADPRWAGQLERDHWEIALYRAARRRDRPVLGICRGCQMINVAEGGTLWQDLLSQRPGSLQHRCQDRYDDLSHGVTLVAGSRVGALFGDEPPQVNSIHHQGLKDVAPALRVVARASDGGVEAVEHGDAAFVVGVQWHPEWMTQRASQRGLFEALVAAAGGAR
jgi:putative glutamine amidotransferase